MIKITNLFLCFITCMTLILIQFQNTKRIFDWDEVDYTQAASQGLWSNYTDKTSLHALEFVKSIRDKIRGDEYCPSRYYNEFNDVFLLRHYHPPVLQYLIELFGLRKFCNPDGSHFLLWFQIAGGCLLICLSYLSHAIIVRDRSSIPNAICISTALLYTAYLLTREIQYHLWFAISVLLFSMALQFYLSKPDQKRLIPLGISSGLCATTLETGIFVIPLTIGLLVYEYFRKRKSELLNAPDSMHDIKRSIIFYLCVTCIFIFIFWPASIIKLSYLRIFAIYGYRIYLGNEYANVNQSIFHHALKLAPLLPWLVFSTVCLIGFRKSLPEKIHPLYYTGLFYLALMMKFALNITYILPFIMLICIYGISCSSLVLTRQKQWLLGLPVSFLSLYSLSHEIQNPFVPVINHSALKELDSLIGTKNLYAEGGHIFQFYMPMKQQSIIPITESADGSKITFRKNMQYQVIDVEHLNEAVLLFRDNNSSPSKVELQILNSASSVSIDGLNARIYVLD